MGGWDAGLGEDSLHAIPVQLFAKHVMDLHMNQEVGFAKEYEEIRAASCLEEFAAQESQNPDNVDRNRYPNIVACKWGIIYKYVSSICKYCLRFTFIGFPSLEIFLQVAL